jgi:hypothetical protein
LQQPRDVLDLAAHDRGVDARGGELGMQHADPFGAPPLVREVERPTREDARVLQQLVLEPLGREREQLMVLLQLRPAREALFTRERLLHLAQPRTRRVLRQHLLETCERLAISGTQRREPALRLLAQGLEPRADTIAHRDLPSVWPSGPLIEGRKKAVDRTSIGLLGGKLPCRGQEAPQPAR